MKCCKKMYGLAVVCSLVMLFFCSCGYNIGARGMAHPQLKSMAIGEIQNNTIEPLVAGYMRMQLAEAVQRDGGMKLKNLGESDCIVYGKINSVTTSTSRQVSYDNDVTYKPAEFTVSVSVQYKVIIPGRGTPIASGTASGSANYEYLGDPNPSRVTALKMACYRASESIVQSVTEGF